MSRNTALLTPSSGDVVTVVKTSALENATTRTFREHITVDDTINEILRSQSRNDSDRQVLEQLRREVAGPHDFFAVTQAGQMIKVDPKTRLSEIAVPRELRMPDGGFKLMPTAAFEVQQYAEVGAV